MTVSMHADAWRENGVPPASPPRLGLIPRWKVWGLPGAVLSSVLLVELAAAVLWVVDLRGLTVDRADVITVAILCGIGVLHTEVAAGIEGLRRRVTDTPHVDLSSVWTFAGAVLLPPAWSTVVAVVVFNHLWLRPWRRQVPLYKHLFSLATVVLACHAAAAAMGYVGGGVGLAALALAILVYTTVNSALVAGAIALNSPTPRPRAEQLWGRCDDNMLELSTLCLGALAALALTSHPWHVALLLPPLLVLHRAVLVRQLEELAATDSKTKLLNAAAWQVQASRELRRAQRSGASAAVLMMDLDHFKSVNDMYGHLAGDVVLGAVAEAVRGEVREPDVVGRFGGEEFVVLLPAHDGHHAGPAELHSIAERIRHRIATLTVAIDTPDGALTIDGLSVSVGGASSPSDGESLEQVMSAADKALYAAKRNGRNAVRIACMRPPAASRGTTTKTIPNDPELTGVAPRVRRSH
jgi:diguanylate cyclase (GGDEF)-like protein